MVNAIDLRHQQTKNTLNVLNVNTGGSEFHVEFKKAYDDIIKNRTTYNQMMMSFKDLGTIFYERTYNVNFIRTKSGTANKYHTMRQFLPDVNNKYPLISLPPIYGTLEFKNSDWDDAWVIRSSACEAPFYNYTERPETCGNHKQTTLKSNMAMGLLDYFNTDNTNYYLRKDANSNTLVGDNQNDKGDSIGLQYNDNWDAYWKDVKYTQIYYVGLNNGGSEKAFTTTYNANGMQKYMDKPTTSTLNCDATLKEINTMDAGISFLKSCNTDEGTAFKQITSYNLALFDIEMIDSSVTIANDTNDLTSWNEVPGVAIKWGKVVQDKRYFGSLAQAKNVPNVFMIQKYKRSNGGGERYYVLTVDEVKELKHTDFVNSDFAHGGITLSVRSRILTQSTRTSSPCTSLDIIKETPTEFVFPSSLPVITADDGKYLSSQPTDQTKQVWCDTKLAAERAAKYLKALKYIMQDMAYSIRRDMILLYYYTNDKQLTLPTSNVLQPSQEQKTITDIPTGNSREYFLVPKTAALALAAADKILVDSVKFHKDDVVTTQGKVFPAQFVLVQLTKDNKKKYESYIPSDLVTENNYTEQWLSLIHI